MPKDSPIADNLHRGMKLRIKTPAGWDELATPGGLEGRQYFFLVRPSFPLGDARNLGGHIGLPGKYKVAVVLNKPGYAELKPGQHLSEDLLEGDSNVYIGKEFADGHRLLIKSHDRDLTIRMVPNKHGRLGKFILDELDAKSLADANASAWQALSAVLNLLSVSLDVPLQISQMEVAELRTGAASGSCVVDYSDVGLYMRSLIAVATEFRFYASMYREALNSSSPPYEFLCLFKIIDSIFYRRKRLAEEAKQRGETLTRPAERFPTADELPDWLNALLPEPAKRDWKKGNLARSFPEDALGRKFGYIIDTHLRPVRVRIAHGVLDTGELGLSIDDPEHIRSVNNLLPLAKFIVRRMMKNEFPTEFLTDVTDSQPVNQEDLAEQIRQLWPDSPLKNTAP